MRKVILLLGILLATTIHAYGQAMNFRAEAPAAVEAESQFKVVFSIPGNANTNNFRIPDIKDFDVLMGPVQDTKKEFKQVDGKPQSYNVTLFTYVLQPRKEGTFTIPAATVTVDNKKYVSNSVTVKVIPKETAAASQNETEIFIRAIAGNTTVYEHEPVLVTFKVYARGFDISRWNVKLEAKDFISQDIDLSDYKYLQWVPESYEGKSYNTIILKQTLFYPQRSGQLEIERGEFDMALRIVSKKSTTIGSYIPDKEIRNVLYSPPVKINVKPLPTGKPKSFANAVGNFTLKSGINATEVKENEPITIKVTLSGVGNWKLMKNPEAQFPADFEVYDPKIESNQKVSSTGVSGSKVIEYLAIPRHAGDFTIPPIEFSYFDLKTKSYKTLKTDTYTLKVAKGDAAGLTQGGTNYVSKESLKFLGEDIRHIHTKNLKLKPKASFFFGSVGFVLCYIIPLLLAAVMFIIFRKQAEQNANIALMRTKKANKMATKRLKIAKQYLDSGEKEKFYDEVLRALWGYFSDKLNIPVANLTKDNIGIELSKAGIDDGLIEDFNTILSTCEFARYAPGNASEEMETVYRDTIEKMEELEEKISFRNK